MITDYFTLSDSELSLVLQSAKREAQRRTEALARDMAGVIKGQEMAKRATLIAAAGGHSIVYMGSPSTGKTMLRALALSLGVVESFEYRPCPCGYRDNPREACRCEIEQITEHMRRMPTADIFVECPPVPTKIMESKLEGTTARDMREQIERMSKPGNFELDQFATELLRHAQNEIAVDRGSAISIATTIARLDGANGIQSQHIAEAVNYRMPRIRAYY
jgi:predicted ATPase with chaperone activity